jgi:hypothetical protein
VDFLIFFECLSILVCQKNNAQLSSPANIANVASNEPAALESDLSQGLHSFSSSGRFWLRFIIASSSWSGVHPPAF